MSEWFKEHDWKSCVGLKLTGGSNPLLCARKEHPLWVLFFGSEKRLRNVRIIGGSRECHPQTIIPFFPFFVGGTTLCQVCWQYTPSLHQEKHHFEGVFSRTEINLSPFLFFQPVVKQFFRNIFIRVCIC